jgi:hypothetical protein
MPTIVSLRAGGAPCRAGDPAQPSATSNGNQDRGMLARGTKPAGVSVKLAFRNKVVRVAQSRILHPCAPGLP